LGVLTASRDPDQALDVQLRDHAFRGNMTERLVRVYRDVINRRKTITGLIGAALIGLSMWWSVRHKRKFPDGEIEDALRAE
jgi:hypothetical protein